MNYRRLFAVSIGMKVLLIVLSISLVGFQYILAKVWFNPIADPRRVENELKDDPKSVDIVDDRGVTGLMFCAQEGFPKRATILIDNQASLNMLAKNEYEKDNDRRYRNTALHFAVLNGDDKGSYEVGMLLIDRGADVRVENGQGFTPLHMVMEIDNMDQRKKLTEKLVAAAGNKVVQQGYLNIQNKNGDTMLHLAAEMNRMDWIAWLISQYGKMLKFDIKNNKDQLPEDKAFAHGGDLRRRMKKMRELYDKTPDAEFKKLPFMSY